MSLFQFNGQVLFFIYCKKKECMTKKVCVMSLPRSKIHRVPISLDVLFSESSEKVYFSVLALMSFLLSYLAP